MAIGGGRFTNYRGVSSRSDENENPDLGVVGDTFSAETVHGPAAGEWGQGGTAASGYDAYQTRQGQQALQGAQQQGAAAQGTADRAQFNAQQAAQAAQGRAAPTTDWSGANAAAAQWQQARGGTQGTLDALNAFAAQQGQGPSAAQAQLQSAMNQGLSNQLALARSGRGFGGNAAAMGQAAGNMAQISGNAATASGMLTAQEQQQAQQNRLNALNSALGGGIQQQGQDLAAQAQAAGQSQFDVNTALQQQQLNDAYGLGQGQLGLGYFGAGNQANLGWNQLGQNTALQREQLGQNALNSQANYELGKEGLMNQAEIANQQADLEKDSANASMFSSLLAGIGFSDERAKELGQRERALADALDTVGNAPGYSYKYKDPTQFGAKPGHMVGPMAQDIERGPLGDTIVTDTPQGKMLDYGRLESVNTSAITELNRKVKALEAALGRNAA